jgi:hypothetical protein
MKQYEVWVKSTNEFCGTFDTIEEARAVRKGVAMFYGIFECDFEIISVVNQ